jgi:DNA-binding CsgD family transcriptional regulator
MGCQPFAGGRIPDTPSGVCMWREPMEKLADNDFRKVLGAIEILGADVDYATLPRRVVDAIAAVIDVDFISFNEVDTASGMRRFLLRPDPEELEPGSFEYAAFIRRFGNHPVVAQKVAAGRDSNPDLRKFVSRLRLLGMVGNCCGEAELRLQMGVNMARSGSSRVGVAIYRSVRDFDDRDAAALDLLRPHVVAAYLNTIRTRDSAASEPSPARPADASSLTRRESEVLYWVSMGKTNEEVSLIIGARPLTVKKHLEHIYDKLGVPNRTAAARVSVALPTA